MAWLNRFAAGGALVGALLSGTAMGQSTGMASISGRILSEEGRTLGRRNPRVRRPTRLPLTAAASLDGRRWHFRLLASSRWPL